MRASLGKAGKGKTLRLFCAECFLASGICWGGGRGGGVWCAGCTGLGGSAGPYLHWNHVRIGPFGAVSKVEVYPAGKLQ